jgi:hypothetical protein
MVALRIEAIRIEQGMNEQVPQAVISMSRVRARRGKERTYSAEMERQETCLSVSPTVLE